MAAKQFKYILTFAHEVAFSKAVDVLNITQPSQLQYIRPILLPPVREMKGRRCPAVDIAALNNHLAVILTDVHRGNCVEGEAWL